MSPMGEGPEVEVRHYILQFSVNSNPERESMPARYLLNGKEMSLTEIVKLAQRCGYRGPIRVVSSQMKAILKKQGYDLTKK